MLCYFSSFVSFFNALQSSVKFLQQWHVEYALYTYWSDKISRVFILFGRHQQPFITILSLFLQPQCSFTLKRNQSRRLKATYILNFNYDIFRIEILWEKKKWSVQCWKPIDNCSFNGALIKTINAHRDHDSLPRWAWIAKTQLMTVDCW